MLPSLADSLLSPDNKCAMLALPPYNRKTKNNVSAINSSTLRAPTIAFGAAIGLRLYMQVQNSTLTESEFDYGTNKDLFKIEDGKIWIVNYPRELD